MSVTYRNAALAPVTTSLSDVYVCPGGATALVRAVHIANLDPDEDQTVNVSWTDASQGNTARALIVGAVVPQKAAFQLLDQPLVLEPGDKLQASAGTTGKLTVTVSVAEST